MNQDSENASGDDQDQEGTQQRYSVINDLPLPVRDDIDIRDVPVVTLEEYLTGHGLPGETDTNLIQ